MATSTFKLLLLGNGFFKFDGSTISGTGLVLGGACSSLLELPGSKLAVGGQFSTANGVPVRNLAILDLAQGFQSAGAIENGGQFSAYAQSPNGTSRYIGGYLNHGYWENRNQWSNPFDYHWLLR